jgi:hypothetical protein
MLKIKIMSEPRRDGNHYSQRNSYMNLFVKLDDKLMAASEAWMGGTNAVYGNEPKQTGADIVAYDTSSLRFRLLIQIPKPGHKSSPMILWHYDAVMV